MKVTVLGSGNAFTLLNYQSSFLIEFNDGYKLLFDCGSDIRFALRDAGLSYKDIDGIYVSHLHSDHIGGGEYMGFCSYFDPTKDKMDLFISRALVDDLWNNTLRGGMASLEGKVCNLDDYFNVQPIESNESIHFGDEYTLTPVQTVHFMNGFVIVPSFGLMINVDEWDNKYKLYITSDTQYCPEQICKFYDMADVIFHDCETAQYKSHVHAHYKDLSNLPIEYRNKMWLYHYQDSPYGAPDIDAMDGMAIKDGFRGFLKRGQVLFGN